MHIFEETRHVSEAASTVPPSRVRPRVVYVPEGIVFVPEGAVHVPGFFSPNHSGIIKGG